MSYTFNAVDLAYLTPFFILACTGMLLALAEAFLRGPSQARLMTLAVAGCVGAGISAVVLYRALDPGEARPLLYGMLVADRVGYLFVALASALTAGTAMVSARHQEAHDWAEGAVHGTMLLATAGITVMVMAGDLATIFLGIETMSLAVRRARRRVPVRRWPRPAGRCRLRRDRRPGRRACGRPRGR